MYQFHPVNTGFVDDLVGLFVGMHFDVGCGKRCGDLRKERFGDVTVHEEFFSGVADADALRFGVDVAICGRNASAMSLCTRSFSVALQTPTRCVLAL
ncbi:hypothetical protein KHP57_23445, partial [Algiphilus sp. NNCM1]|nr:hypothetical protein [Algiphilus acroporae]